MEWVYSYRGRTTQGVNNTSLQAQDGGAGGSGSAPAPIPDEDDDEDEGLC